MTHSFKSGVLGKKRKKTSGFLHITFDLTLPDNSYAPRQNLTPVFWVNNIVVSALG